MRRILLSATSLATTLLFLVPGVQAQDTPHDWSGPYVGANLGIVRGTGTISLDFTDPLDQGSSPSSVSIPMLGPSGSIVAGYNAQVGRFVYGIEADGTLLSIKGSFVDPPVTALVSPGPPPVIITSGGTTANERLDTLLSLRGRLGLTDGSLLFYLTAGVATGYSGFDITTTGGVTPGTPTSAAGWVYGGTGGIGVEYAVNDNVSLTAEGLVTNLGPLTATGDNGKGPYTATGRTSTATVTGGLKFHF
jgi:outer membrane immunogenic protein